MFLLKPKFVITLAILTGLLAAYGVYHFLKQQEARTTDSSLPTFVSRRVVVAVTDLPVGSQLTPLDMQVRMWPENLIPAGSADSLEKLVGRVLRVEIAAGEPQGASSQTNRSSWRRPSPIRSCQAWCTKAVAVSSMRACTPWPSPGSIASASAAAPATNGVAIDVPLQMA